MSKADGSVIIDTKMDTSGVQKGTEEIKDELTDVGKESAGTGEKIGGDLAGSFKKLGAAIVAAGVIDKIVDFGKEATNLGSDLEEVQNVVDVTFTTMSKKVDKFAKDAKNTAGLSEKMAKQYVGTFGAMADSFGFAEEEAYEMSTALTQLTGDVASFYNLSQDEAYTKLKSVFTGETESLKDLGVVMTQTALDAYALANGFNKTTDSMTEQEKVALRYQFVMDQLSGASGDFVRTQEGWANQSRVLALQWESLMATLGTGLISMLSPGVEFLNNKALPAINKFAEDFAEAMSPRPSEELAKSMRDFEGAIEDVNTQFKASQKEIEINAIKARNYKERLDELEASGLDTADSQREYADAVSHLNELYPELNLQIDEQTGLLDDNSRAQLLNLDAMKERALYAAMEEKYTALYAERADAMLAVAEAQSTLNQLDLERKSNIEYLKQTTGMEIEALKSLYIAQQQLNTARQTGDATAAANAARIQAEVGATRELTQEEMELIQQIYALDSEIGALNNRIEDGEAVVAQYDAGITALGEQIGILSEESGNAADSQNEITTAVTETKAALDELETTYETAKDAARASIDAQIGMFDELVVESDISTSDIVHNWQTQQQALEQYRANLKKAIEMGLDEALVKQLSDGSVESMAILDAFVNSTDTDVDEINEAFRKTEEAKDTVADAMADVQTEMGKKLSEIESQISSSWGDMNEDVRAAVAEMQATIDSLRGKTIYVDVIERTSSGGTSSTSNSVTQAPYAMQAYSVPYLASGAVIPPNAPFYAVLGDQKHGTNIEAPLSTIQEAVRTEMGDLVSGMMAGLQALLEEQQATRRTIESIEVGDTIIGEAADRYQRELAVMRGGL